MDTKGRFNEIVHCNRGSTSILLDVHCVAINVENEEGEAKRKVDWMTRDLWHELLKTVSPIVEGQMTADLVKEGSNDGKKKSNREDAIVLESEHLRLACLFRKSQHESLRIVRMDSEAKAKHAYLYGKKLVIGAAFKDPAGEGVGGNAESLREVQKAIGASTSESISQYFVKS